MIINNLFILDYILYFYYKQIMNTHETKDFYLFNKKQFKANLITS